MSTPSLCIELRASLGALTLDVALDTAGGVLVLVGPNGAGKSSVLSMTLGVHPVEAGRIEVGGVRLLDTATGLALPIEQRRLGYVPQHYALFPHLNVRGNVAFAVQSAAEIESAEHVSVTARVDAALTELGVAQLADRFPHTLSGGERQRVALARALAVRPRALLLDEPLAALDVHARRSVRATLAQTLRKLALPALVVTHDAADAKLLGDRVAVLEAGRITQVGTWAELCARPGSAFIEELVSSER